MEQYVEIAANACFMGLVNAASYEGFIGGEVEFEQLEKRVLAQMRRGHILFWGAPVPNRWTLRVTDQAQAPTTIQSFKGYLEVTTGMVQVVNYAALLDAAEFEEDSLPTQSLESVALPKGWYQLTVCQLFDENKDALDEESLGYEIICSPVSKVPSSPVNAIDEIPWSIY